MAEDSTFEFFNKEIDEANEILNRQHLQIKWYVQIYLLALFGFFSLAGFLFRKETTSSSLYNVDVIIIACAIIIFFLGWLLLSALAHKVSIINLIYKHLATMRLGRIEHINNIFIKGYAFPLSSKEIKLPGMIKHMPYLFFVLNYNILCGCVFFIAYKYFGILNAINISICTAVLAGLFYPRVCVTFNKHIRASEGASSFPDKQYLEQEWEEKRRSKIDPFGLIIKYGLLLFLFFVSLASTICSALNFLEINSYYLLVITIVSGGVFGLFRYFFEIVDLNIGFKFRKSS